MTSRLDELKDRHVENILDEDQLEKVAGGTARENGQLYTAIRMNPALFNEIGGGFSIEDVLKDKFGIYYNSITQNKNHAHKKNGVFQNRLNLVDRLTEAKLSQMPFK